MLHAALLVCSLSAASANIMLQGHTSTSICPGSITSYECSGAELFLSWVAELNGMELAIKARVP